MKIILIFSFLLPTLLLAQEDCQDVFTMTIFGHRRDENYRVQYCKGEEPSIVASFNSQESTIRGKHVKRILKKFDNIDPNNSLSDLEKNCNQSDIPFVKALYKKPGQKERNLCLLKKSPPLFHYRHFLKSLVYTDAYQKE